MMKKIARLKLLIFLLLAAASTVSAQILKPVKWSYAAKKLDDKHAVIYLKAVIDDGWHIYSVNQPEGGPQKTLFTFKKVNGISLVGKPSEPEPEKHFEKAFGIDVFYFEHSVIFQQKVSLKRAEAIVKGHLTYMACNDHQCLPPEDLDFAVPVK